MKTLIMYEKTKLDIFLEILNDPVYGPNSPFFWPGTVWHAEDFVFCDTFDCRSTKDFLEDYKYNYSGVEGYIENTEDPEKEHIDEMYAHFHKLYHGIESWPYHIFVVSALYRVVFDEIFPYQSKQYEVTKSSRFDVLNRAYLSKGLYDRAITSVSWQSLEKTQQDKVGGRISKRTWDHLTRMLLNPNLDALVFKEVTRLLKQYNLVDAYPEDFKKELLSLFDFSLSYGGLVEPVNTKQFKEFTDRLLVCLSLLRIPTEKGE